MFWRSRYGDEKATMAMQLGDWPIYIGDSYGDITCYQGDGCDWTPNLDPGLVRRGAFGELAKSIVDHAKAEHGIEIKPSGYWYRSFWPDGELCFESSQATDFGPVELPDEMEPEEREHWEKHNEVAKTLRYERIAVYTLSIVEEWTP